jgi:hypothetical protein
MIQEYVDKLAVEMGVERPVVTIIDASHIGMLDVYLVRLAVGNHLVNTVVHQKDLNELQNNTCCDWLEVKIRSALSRLQGMLKP